MPEKDDGGPAFPFPKEIERPDSGEISSYIACSPGMSMRDWFAGQALIAYQIGDEFAAWRRNQQPGGPGQDATYIAAQSCDEVATQCYKQADAMLKARTGK